jgi:uncharacterized protein YjcR
MKWAEQVAHMEESRDAYRFWWKNLKERDHLEHPGVDGNILLKWISRKWDGDMDWTDSEQGQVARYCECCNEPTVSIKCRELGSLKPISSS